MIKDLKEIQAIKKVTIIAIERINYMELIEEQLQNLSNVEIDDIIALLYKDVVKIEQNKIMSIELYKELGQIHKKIENFKKLK